ncbi:MAG: 23S rRNA (uracil(1939)-C(5))-methyltransferase RlmD [Erysipelotrichales bacterium]|nr:23S rRNA (uracil(1939)-C(5))-methyltransferase RlmD [Erysipelotrichales bacterium]
MNKGETFQVVITGFDFEGLGVTRVDNFVVFVIQGVIGDELLIKITNVKRNFAFAEIVEIKKASINRVKPFCQNFGKCGGCDLWHISYETQLTFKSNLVKDTLKKIANLEISGIKIFGHQGSFNYRNKVQIPFQEMNGQIVYGFYEKNSHLIVSLNNCQIQDPIHEKILISFKEIIQENKLSAYNEKLHSGLLRHLIFRKNLKNELMLILVINGRINKKIKDCLLELANYYPEIKSIYINLNPKRTNVILGQEMFHIFGKEVIIDSIDDLAFEISPDSFFQINPYMTKTLYQEALKMADISKDDIVVDCYSGIGTISLFLAKKAKYVYGIEIVKNAVLNAKNNSKLNKVENIKFIEGDVPAKIGEILKKTRIDVIVFDPPRKGLGTELLSQLIPYKIKKMIYISCDIKSASKDIKYLFDNNYQIKEAVAFDMFPGTKHVESCFLLELK